MRVTPTHRLHKWNLKVFQVQYFVCLLENEVLSAIWYVNYLGYIKYLLLFRIIWSLEDLLGCRRWVSFFFRIFNFKLNTWHMTCVQQMDSQSWGIICVLDIFCAQHLGLIQNCHCLRCSFPIIECGLLFIVERYTVSLYTSDYYAMTTKNIQVNKLRLV
jgi:hypothetical protein